MTNLLTAIIITLSTNWVPVHHDDATRVEAGVIYEVTQAQVHYEGVTRTFLLSSNLIDQPLLRREHKKEPIRMWATNYWAVEAVIWDDRDSKFKAWTIK